MKKILFVLISVMLIISCALLGGCNGATNSGGNGTAESTTPEITAKEYGISYDLDGGFDGGNPDSYTSEDEVTLKMPIRPGYDFVGWTGTGLTEANKKVTVAKGTEGDLSFKANWVENGELVITPSTESDDELTKVFNKEYKMLYIVYDENATAQTIVAAQNLRSALSEKGVGVRLLPQEDKEFFDLSTSYEIYFGMTEAAETAELINSLNYTQYGVAVYEDKMVAVGWTEKAAEAARGLLYEIVEHVAKGGSLYDFCGAVYTGTVEGQVGADIPALEGLDSVTDVGEGAFQVYSLDSTMDIYTDYLAKLESVGYTKYTDNVMGKAHFATYVKDDTVVNVQFGNGDPEEVLHKVDRALRVIVEPLSNTTLPMLEKPEDADAKVTACSITMLDHSSIQDGNLCLIIKLSNGHFIIVDSNRNGTQRSILDTLREQATDRNNIIIDAWFLTHFHQDHIGGFVEFAGLSSIMRYVTINAVIYNFPQDQVIQTASHSVVDMSNMRKIPDLMNSLREGGTNIYQARTGQKYYFGNAEVEILWTFEDIAPHNIFEDRSNPTCIGFSITIEGQKLMITGDSSTEEFRVADKRYGEYLKSDIVQLSHHGYGDGNVAHNFYKWVNAPYVLNSGMGQSYGSAERWAMDNATVYILRDNYGTCIIPLPYDGGKFETKPVA